LAILRNKNNKKNKNLEIIFFSTRGCDVFQGTPNNSRNYCSGDGEESVVQRRKEKVLDTHMPKSAAYFQTGHDTEVAIRDSQSSERKYEPRAEEEED